MISVHDNSVYGYSVDCANQRLILHTVFEDAPPSEFTDVVFNGVIAHTLEYVNRGNILFDIAEVDPCSIVDSAASLFQDSWRHGWPELDYKGDLDCLKQLLQQLSILGFEIASSCGLSGWVLAQTCDRLPREAMQKMS